MPHYCGKTMSGEELANLAIERSRVDGHIVESMLVEQLKQAIHAKYLQGMRDGMLARRF